MTEFATLVMDNLIDLCKKIDVIVDDLEESQKVGIMMDHITLSCVHEFAEEFVNYPKDNPIETIKTSSKNRCCIVLDNMMPLFEVKACIIQPIEL